jgi:hypothetical protein
MSRTDNHRPYDVQLADPHEQRWHRISDGHKVTWWPLYRFGCRPHCICCSYFLPIYRRRNRHQAQHRVHEALKGNWEACD